MMGEDINTSIMPVIGPPRFSDPSAFRTMIGASSGDVVSFDFVTNFLSTKQLVAPQSTRTLVGILSPVSVVVIHVLKMMASSELMRVLSTRFTSVGVERATEYDSSKGVHT